MAQILSQCSITVTPVDTNIAPIDISRGYAKDATITINQKNQMFRGVASINQAGDVVKIGLDEQNTFEINTLAIPEDDLKNLDRIFNESKLVNISLIYNTGQNAGRKYLMTGWTLTSLPVQATISGTPDNMTMLSFAGFLFEAIGVDL